jgi:hypothetical protein
MRPAGGTDGTKASSTASGGSDGSGTASGSSDGSSTASGGAMLGGNTADRDQADGTVATFRAAIAEVEAGLGRMRGLRPGLTFEQEPAPRKLAPYAASVAVTVRDAGGDVGWGRFVLLYDPAGQRGWGGPFRIIGHIRVDLEPEIAADPLVGEVGWSWLTEALDARTVGYQQTSGTVTRVVTEGFGAKRDEPVMTEFELRASWSPACGAPGKQAPDHAGPGSSQAGGLGLDGHVAAWCDALCAAAGLPPVAPGVRALRQPPGRRSR